MIINLLNISLAQNYRYLQVLATAVISRVWSVMMAFTLSEVQSKGVTFFFLSLSLCCTPPVLGVLVHDFKIWFARELEKLIMMRLKKWAGLYRGSDVGALFRRREHLGLQLTSLVEHYKRMQEVKCCLLCKLKRRESEGCVRSKEGA